MTRKQGVLNTTQPSPSSGPQLQTRRTTFIRRIIPTLLALTCALTLVTAGFFPGNAVTPAQALANNLALTPPMGFNDWNAFGCGVTEQEIKQATDFIASHLKSAGYQYVNVDDCWMSSSRDSSGNLVADPKKFPDGMKSLASYVHKAGLLFGIYEGAGNQTCAGRPGSYKHETQDANLFASWGVDYLKYDWCNGHSTPFSDFPGQTHDQVAQTLYKKMSNALLATNHPIVFAMCNGADSAVHPANWGTPVANLWRTTHDIKPTWDRILSNYNGNVGLYAKAGPGHWNDPDMLEIGNGSLTKTEEQAHFSLWAVMAAPLLIGTNLLKANTTTLSILGQKSVIDVDQDSLGTQGHLVSQSSSGQQVLAKPLSNGDVAVVLFNSGSSTATISTTASAVGLPSSSSYLLENLWAGTKTTTSSKISASVPSHGVVMYRVHP